MECPLCGDDTKVLDSTKYNGSVYRKRKCKECEYVYYTEERECNPYMPILALTNRHTESKRYKREMNKYDNKS